MKVFLLPISDWPCTKQMTIDEITNSYKLTDINLQNPRLGKIFGKNSKGWMAIFNGKVLTDWSEVTENSVIYILSKWHVDELLNYDILEQKI